jgi:hypothetical protein
LFEKIAKEEVLSFGIHVWQNGRNAPQPIEATKLKKLEKDHSSAALNGIKSEKEDVKRA